MSDDSIVDLKKRARRRLVGATALALLAVILLPIMMDGEPKPSGQDLQVRIPSKDADAFVARVMPASPPLSTVQGQGADKASLISEDVQKSVSNLAEPVEAGQAISATVVAPAVIAKPRTELPTVKPELPEKTEAARAEAALEGRDSGRWIVQLGAYQNASNVKQLTAKLKEIGLPSYTEKFDSPQGPRTRVRAGPFKSLEAADKARLRIKKIGVDGSVVKQE